ncbi:hypothetical protein D9615_009383 [Tricholomella constricta]|uniref:ATP-dependent RNA helicase n=1 Tax=Tricholomella constricta TaxID=117010 RepID=A0A8H5LZX6_9AGAR|nr:hypothetical protein D9615_009383 [Tricholomella constricta]
MYTVSRLTTRPHLSTFTRRSFASDLAMAPRDRRPRAEDSPVLPRTALTANSTVGAPTNARPAKKLKQAPAPAPVKVVQVQPAPERAQSPTASRHFSDRKFQDANLSTQSKAGIEHEFMSDVQAATLDLGLAGKDLLVQAKTGTGKTIAFLLPAIERLLKAKQPLKGISVLVLAPTRELALQIEEEAKQLLKHHKRFTVGHVIGGTKANQSLNTLLKKPPTILIATPGRLHDHLSSPEIAVQFSSLQALVYDEADRLLDQGFRRELRGILSALPDRRQVPRQVMLFSATISDEIKQISKETLSADHAFVSTLLEDEVNTHAHVPQTHIIAPFASTLPLALHILRQERLTHALPTGTTSLSKTIVFFPTARHVSFAYELLSTLPGLPPVLELHSRKSQDARTKASARFRDATEAVLLSSDVAARGMDFPGVTLVLQLNLPASTEQYIHRLGRTARAGAGGRGILVLDPAEQRFLALKDVRPLGIAPDPQFAQFMLSPAAQEYAEVRDATTGKGKGKVDEDTKAQAYRAWLGYYNSHLKLVGWDKGALVGAGNAYVREALGWQGGDGDGALPEIETRMVGKMGLRDVPGLNIVKTAERAARGGSRGGARIGAGAGVGGAGGKKIGGAGRGGGR